MNFTERVAAGRAAEREGAWDGALQEYEAAFAMLAQAGSAADAADLLRWIGTVHRQRGDLDRAEEVYGASLAVAECASLPDREAAVLNCMGIVAQYRGQVARAEASYSRAHELAVAANDDALAAMIDQNRGTLANTRGDHEIAIASFSSAIERFRRLGDDALVTAGLNNLGMAHADSGEWVAAEACYREAGLYAIRVHDPILLGNVELNRASLELRRGDLLAARDCCDRAFEIFTRVECRPGLGEAYRLYGTLFRHMARPGLAESHLARAMELAEASDDRLLAAEVLTQQAELFLEQFHNAPALDRLNRAYRIFSELGARAALLDLDARLDALEETYLRIVAAWADSIDAKDRYTAGHCRRVAQYGCRLAERCGFTGRDLTWFRMGGLLHDVGKTEVPIEIIRKPGRLTDDEWAAMKHHTVAGAEIVEPLNFPWNILPMVRSHHERWDGSGYPDGLAGDRIPLVARILNIADVYDALTTARSYRPAMSHEEAMQLMERDAGSGHDPGLFALFRTLMDESPGLRAGPRAAA